MTSLARRSAAPIAVASLFLALVPAAVRSGDFEVWVEGRVVDENGEPLQGVQITVTREGSNVEIREETNRKGRFRVFLLYGYDVHLFRLELSGYQGTERTIQPIERRGWEDRDRNTRRPAGQKVEMDFTLRSEESIVRQAAEVPEDASPEERRRAAVEIYNEGVADANRTLWARAEEKFRQALELDPELGKAHAALAKVLYERRRCEESLKVGETAREMVPHDLELWNVRVHCLRRVGEHEEAEAAVDELATRAPRLAAPDLLARAHRLYEAHESEAALPVLETVVAAVPEDAQGHYLLGLVLLDLHRADAAREPLERYLELAPDGLEAEDVRALLRELPTTPSARGSGSTGSPRSR